MSERCEGCPRKENCAIEQRNIRAFATTLRDNVPFIDEVIFIESKNRVSFVMKPGEHATILFEGFDVVHKATQELGDTPYTFSLISKDERQKLEGRVCVISPLENAE